MTLRPQGTVASMPFNVSTLPAPRLLRQMSPRPHQAAALEQGSRFLMKVDKGLWSKNTEAPMGAGIDGDGPAGEPADERPSKTTGFGSEEAPIGAENIKGCTRRQGR